MSYKRRSERDSQPVGKQDRYASDHDDDVIIIETGGSSSPEDDLPAISVKTPQTCKTSKSHIQSTRPVNRSVFHSYRASHELGTPPLQRSPSSYGKKEIVPASKMILTKNTHSGNSSSPPSRRLHPERERNRERRGYIQNVPQGPLSSGGRKSAASMPRPTHSSDPILNCSVGSNKLPSKISGRTSQHVAHPVPASRKDSRNESFRNAPMSTTSSTTISEKARKTQLGSGPKGALGTEHVRHREFVKSGQSLDSRDKGGGTKKQRVLSPDIRGSGVRERKNGGQRERKHSLGSSDFQRNKVPSVSHPKVLTKPTVSSTTQVVKKAVSNGQEVAISKVANGGGVMDTSGSFINTQSPSSSAYRPKEKGGVRANLSEDPSKISKQAHSVAKQKSSHSIAVSSSRDSTDPKQKLSSGRIKKRAADLDKSAKWTLSTGTISSSVDSVTTTSARSQSGVVVTAKATTNSERDPPSLSKKDSDTETSSMIGFNDDDLFEVLDSVETDSICSAYNQSDSESLGTSSESYCSKLTSVQTSNLTKSVSCKSPSESRLHDFTMSFVKKRPRVARKSTTWNGAKFYKHPIKGGLLRLKRHCTLKLRRVKCTQKLSKLGQKSEPLHNRLGNQNKITCSAVEASATTESDAGDVTPPLAAEVQVSNDMKKKRESKELPPSCVKRLKLSSESEPNKPTLINFNSSSTVKPSMQKKVTSSEIHIQVSSAGNSRTMTPENNHTSGSATPASKKCLSLKRLQLSRTPSLSDAPTENQPLSLPFISWSSSVGGASTQEKQGNNPAHLDPKTNPTQQQSKNSNPTTSQPHAVDTVIHVEGEERPQGTSMHEPSSTFTGMTSVRHAMCGTSENVMSTTSSEQVKHVACGRAERPPSTSSDENSLAKLSQRDEAYDLRLMETIAKLAPESGGSADNTTTTHTRSSVSSEEMEVQSERDEGGVPTLTVKVPLAQLSRTPSVSPSVTTRAIGMFTEKAVQADQGMIVDKDVLDAYLVVKLHEAMFDMKEQLRMMEVQVAAIAKQKENLERMLQSKTQYIRDMVTTGFKRGMEDKETNTDSSLLHSASSSKRGGATANVATQTKRLRIPSTPSKDRKGVKTVAKGTQTDAPDHITVSSQTEGMVRVTPARLETPSQPLCLYRHPDSEMQIYIEQVKHNTSDFNIESESVEENPLISNPNQQWLSGSVANGCSRSVAVNPKVQFLRALRDSTAFVERFGCARCIPSSTIVTNTTPQPTPEKTALPKVQFTTNADTSSDSLPVSSEACHGESVVEGRGYDCIPPSLCSSISKLVDLYCKLKALPKQPVQARHMMSLLKALHHLLSHLPVEIEPLPRNYSPKSAVSQPVASTATSARDAPPSTPTNTTTSSTPTTPLSSERPSSSPPSTPGAATWSMGAKLQELMEALHELEEKGRELLPKYFKGELARLQLMVQDTLTFFTSGIQHETFTHDQSGCIVNSDLQPRPWRDQDLQRNPYFRRLCLDVGVRGIIQQVRKLSQQNRQGKRKYSSDESDLDSDFDIPSPPFQRGTKPTSSRGRGKIRVTREKMKVMKDKARKRVFHVTLPLPSSRGEETSPPSTSEGLLSSTPATSTSPTNTAVCISPSTSPPLSSPSRVSPYSKRITKGETLQVRVAELQSKVRGSVQPVSSQQEAIANTSTVPSTTTSTTVSLTSQSIPSIPSNLDALGGNVSAQYMLSQYIHQHLGRKLSTGPPMASQSSVTSHQGMVNTSTVASKPASTTCTASLTSPSASQTVQSLLTLAATKTAPRPPAAAGASSTHLYKGTQRLQRDPSTANQLSVSSTDSEGASLRKVIDVLLQVFHTIQVTPHERLALQRMIEHAYQLVASAEYDIVKQLIANISFLLHTALSKTMPQFQSGAAVVARPLPTLTALPLMNPMTFPTNIYPTLPSSILPCISTQVTPLLPPHRVLTHSNTRSGPVLSAAQSAAQGKLPPTTTVSVSQSATNPKPQPLAVREVVESTAALTNDPVKTSTVDTTATSATNATTSTSTGTIASKPTENTPPSSTPATTSSVTSTAPTGTPSQVSESQRPTKRLGEKTPSTTSPTVAASTRVCSSSSGGSNSPVFTPEGAVVPLCIARIENAVVSGSSSSADNGLENLLTTMSVLSQREPSMSSSATTVASTTLVSSPDGLRVTTSTCTSISGTTTPSSTSTSTAHPPLSAPTSGVPTATHVPVSNVSPAHAPNCSVSSVTTAQCPTSTTVPSSTAVTTAVTTAQCSTSTTVPSSTAVTTAQCSTSTTVPSSTAVTTAQCSTSTSAPSSTAVTTAQCSTPTSFTSVTTAHRSNRPYTRPVEVPSVVSQGHGAHVKQPVTQHSTSTSSAPSSTVTTAITIAQHSTAVTTAQCFTSVPSSTVVTTAQCTSVSTAVTSAHRSNRPYTHPVEVPSVVSQGHGAHMKRPVTHASPPSSITNPTLRQLSQAIQQCPQPVVRSQAIQKAPPPAVKVQASKVFNGLLIKWTLSPEYLVWQNLVVQYDLYAFVCNNKDTKIPDVSLWCKVGEIKPLALPMAVTLTNFAVGQRYAFSVRAKYLSGATSDYSEPCTIDL